MKAITYHNYGGPEELNVEEVERPTPGDGQVLVRVRATALNAADKWLLMGTPRVVRLMNGLRSPKRTILGADVAGTVEAVGPGVSTLREGDAVFGDLSSVGLGGLAEFACVPETVLAPKPASASFAQAAAVPLAGVTALQALRTHAKLQPGERVVVSGASGGVGSFAIQLAKHFGAHVIAVCSATKAEQARRLGADEVIDYREEDFTERVGAFDVILGVNGFYPLGHYKRALASGGRYVMIGGESKQMTQAMIRGPLASLASGKKMGSMLAKANHDDLAFLAGLLGEGEITPIIEAEYPFESAPEAMARLIEGHAAGKLVVVQEG
jgi:NADPH:quinone reductase-like Zn-dependent oxidoreductase